MNGRSLSAPPQLRFDPEQTIRVAGAALFGTLALLYFWFGQQGAQLYDFGSFWASGKAAVQGQNPYAVYLETFRSAAGNTVHPNLNPPFSLLFFAPLSHFDPHSTIKVLWWLGLAAYAAFLALTLRRTANPNTLLVGVWALALPAFWDGIRMGQVYLPMMLGAALVWHWMEKERPIAAAVVIGLLTALKPNLLVWPALLFVAGYRRMALVAGLTFIGASLLPLPFFGMESYLQWFELLRGDVGQRSGYFANATVVAIGVRAGSHLLGIALAAATLAWAVRRLSGAGFSMTEASAIAIGAAILVSPVAWMHYLLLLLPALLRMRWNRGVAVSAAVMAVPLPAFFWMFKILPLDYPAIAGAIRATIGSPYSWATLLLVASMVRSYARRHEEPLSAPQS
jgi:hypothetical protein